MPDEKTPDELQRQFEAAIAGPELDELRDVVTPLRLVGRDAVLPVPRPPRPNLRRPPLKTRATYRIRVDLDESQPPIWRRLDVRSDVTLDVVHQVLQAAFDWTNSHLHRFALGGDPFDAASEWFLCPYDVEEADEGAAASTVRLDETVQEPGDVLRYVYDYGDHWGLTLRLEEVRDVEADAPLAGCVDGRRAAPPEDCGSLRTASELAEVLDDPAHFDVAAVNTSFRGPFFRLLEFGVPTRYVDIVHRLSFTADCGDFAQQLMSLADLAPEPTLDEKCQALRAVQWFLDEASGEGLELTSAGYLKPHAVEEAAAVVPSMADWIGKNNREANAIPLLDFRKQLQSIGLLRKYKGRLKLTKAGASVRDDPEELWDYLAKRLMPAERSYTQDATLLVLGDLATASEGTLSRSKIALALTRLNWRHSDGAPIGSSDLYWLEPSPFAILANVSDRPHSRRERDRLSPEAVALARQALRATPHVERR